MMDYSKLLLDLKLLFYECMIYGKSRTYRGVTKVLLTVLKLFGNLNS